MLLAPVVPVALNKLRLTLLALALWLPLTAGQAQTGAPIQWADVQLIDGRTLSASALRDKVVVVEFWASWCPFCARQNPHLQRLHERHGRELQVLTFSIDAKVDDARQYLKQHRYTFPTAMAGAQSAAWFPRSKGLPVVYVVDRSGRIVFHAAGELFEEDIAALARFAAPPPKAKP